MAGFNDYADILYEASFLSLGQEATFSPAIGEPFNLYVKLKKPEEFQPPGQINYAKTRYIIEYMRKDIDRRVVRNETFTIDGTDYIVFSMSTYPDSWNTFKGECLAYPS